MVFVGGGVYLMSICKVILLFYRIKFIREIIDLFYKYFLLIKSKTETVKNENCKPKINKNILLI